MSEGFTKSQARNIFFGGSLFFLAVFVALTVHRDPSRRLHRNLNDLLSNRCDYLARFRVTSLKRDRAPFFSVLSLDDGPIRLGLLGEVRRPCISDWSWGRLRLHLCLYGSILLCVTVLIRDEDAPQHDCGKYKDCQ